MSRATVPKIVLPQSSASKSARYDHDQITGSPSALAPGADSFSNNMNSLSETDSMSRVTSHNEALKMELPHRCVCSNPILEPKPGLDVVALIFILLLLPQSWSCLMLTSYILSGSFKSLFGKFISRFLVQSDNYSYLFIEGRTKSRAIYYRSELLCEFLQLFSINSFILLLCRFTFPRAWLRYLSVLAKSIIAGKLVGTHSTGSTTYVSVVSNNSTNTASVTTTTTTNSGHAQSSKALPNLSCSAFGNFITGFAFVIATDYIKDRTSGHLAILSRLSELLLSSSGELFNQILLYSSSKNLSRNSSSYFEESKLLSTNASWMTNTVIRVFRKLFRISGRSIRGVNHLSHDLVVIVNFAYLVLCIHVISLTVSPILRRIFILKDYSRTLDHLACITPDFPYGGLKKSGAAFATLRDSVSDSIVVINMEQSAFQQLTKMAPFEIKVDSEISRAPIKTTSQNHIKSTTAENFKFFCMRLPAMKTLVPGSKQNHTRTIVDRKRSNSSTNPSTTIMDKYFTVSTQPLWAWIAAIKILIVAPILFSGRNFKSEKQNIYLPINGLQLALSSVGKFELIFQVLDHAFFETLVANLSVQVNSEPWLLVDILKTNSFTKSPGGVFISVFGLSPSCCYKVEFLDKDQVIGHHAVSTASYNESSHGFSKSFSDTDLLRSSLMSSLSKLVEMRAGFKKEKKEESKRIADLRRQIDSLIAKSEKYGSTEAIESRIGGKLKGLQNSVTQLENEINELERKVLDLSSRAETFQIDFESEESKLKKLIFESEKLVHEWDTKANNFKLDAKGISTEREAADSKLRKIEDKFKVKHEELSKLHGEVKSLKRDLVSKIKKRQEDMHDRIECMVWKIDEAIEKLRDELWSFSHSKN